MRWLKAAAALIAIGLLGFVLLFAFRLARELLSGGARFFGDLGGEIVEAPDDSDPFDGDPAGTYDPYASETGVRERSPDSTFDPSHDGETRFVPFEGEADNVDWNAEYPPEEP